MSEDLSQYRKRLSLLQVEEIDALLSLRMSQYRKRLSLLQGFFNYFFREITASQYRKRLSLLQEVEGVKFYVERDFEVTIPQAVITSAGAGLETHTLSGSTRHFWQSERMFIACVPIICIVKTWFSHSSPRNRSLPAMQGFGKAR